MSLSPCFLGRSFEMKRLSRIAIATALLMCPPAGVSLAQNAPSTDAPAATTPAPAPTTAPAAEPAAAPPAATTTTTTDTPTKKKKPTRKMSRRQEIDRSIDSGTVPSRYRSSVPKEYQQYIPFSK
jgi:hypothetical protein